MRAALEASLADDALLRVVRKKLPDIGLADLRESLGRTELTVRSQSVPLPSNPVCDGKQPEAPKPGHQATTAVSIAALIAAGLVTPPLALEKTYKGVMLKATIESDGTISCLGKLYESLSAAGGAALRAAGSDPDAKSTACNGWAFWQYADPMTGHRRPIDDLRQQYLHA